MVQGVYAVALFEMIIVIYLIRAFRNFRESRDDRKMINSVPIILLLLMGIGMLVLTVTAVSHYLIYHTPLS